MAWILDNKEWLFSGVGIVIIAWVFRLFYKQRQTSSQTIKSGDNSTNIQAGRDINMTSKDKGSDAKEG